MSPPSAAPPIASLPPGSPLLIIGGKYKGKCGKVGPKGATPVKVWVDVDGMGDSPVCLSQASVSSTSSLASALENMAVNSTPAGGTPRLASPTRTPPPQTPPWQLAASADAPPTPLSGRRVQERIVEEPTPVCFLTQRFPDERLEVRDVNLPTRGAPTALLLPRFRNRGGFSLELVSAKVHADGHGPHGQRKQLYRLCYVKVAGGGLAPLDLRRELEKLADFGGADSTVRKLAARLELLQSPSNPGIALELHAGDFSFVPEPAGFGGLDMSDGCGFVPDDLLLELVGGGVGALAAVRALIDEERLPVKKHVGKDRRLLDIVREVDAARAARDGLGLTSQPSCAAAILKLVAVQVRVFGPRIGVAKGVLMRKPGITKIELPPSMRKLNPSLVAGPDDDWASIIVTNEHPFKSNIALGKLLAAPPGEAHAPKSYQPKELSAMFVRLWAGLGVPRHVVGPYLARYQADPAQHIAHAWLVGVADPTAALPEGHVFVTGLLGTRAIVALEAAAAARGASDDGGSSSGSLRLFVTRSPCIKASDGRMLPLLTSRPAAMTPAVWGWLCALPFGALVFSTRGEGVPLASTIADGDVDGDLYLTCWEPTILARIEATPPPHEPPPPPEASVAAPTADAPVDAPVDALPLAVLLPEDAQMVARDGSWLEQVQAHLTDPSVLGEQALTGKLYKQMEKRAHELGDINHPDVVALGKAYVQSLERPKHGKAITLPAHLHDL